MYRRLWILACWLVFCRVAAQPAGFSPMKNRDAFEAKFKSTHQAINSITCQFSQERKISELDDVIVSTGTLTFKKNNKIRLEYDPPLAHTIVGDGQRFLFQEKGKVRESRASYQKINSLLSNAVDGSLLGRKEFQAHFFESNTSFLVVLTPAKSLKAFFKSIQLFVSPASGLVQSMVIEEPDGDYTKFVIKEPRINLEIPDTVFTLK